MKTLFDYGWNIPRQQEWDELGLAALAPARIIADYGQKYIIATPEKVAAKITGNLMHTLKSVDMPKIGDWVAVELNDQEPATIQQVLSRTSELVRGQAGRMVDRQVIASNVDLALILQPIDHDFSPERLERYIFQLSTQHIESVIILNKTDKAHDLQKKLEQLRNFKATIFKISALHDTDLTHIESLIMPGKTAVILGSSGAGKSTLTNRLLGEEIQATQAIREKDSKGRHTTVHRELFVLPNGGMIIDTPGIRELQLWGDESDLEATFPEIFTTARECHYNNCSHTTEDRCAIKSALESGDIAPDRYRIYLNFKRELQTLESRREFISDRRTEQSKASAKRRKRRQQNIDDTDYKNF